MDRISTESLIFALSTSLFTVEITDGDQSICVLVMTFPTTVVKVRGKTCSSDSTTPDADPCTFISNSMSSGPPSEPQSKMEMYSSTGQHADLEGTADPQPGTPRSANSRNQQPSDHADSTTDLTQSTTDLTPWIVSTVSAITDYIEVITISLLTFGMFIEGLSRVYMQLVDAFHVLPAHNNPPPNPRIQQPALAHPAQPNAVHPQQNPPLRRSTRQRRQPN